MISTYLIDIIILLIASVITVPIFQAAKLGAVPGFLVAGIIVGPYGLGLINNIDEIGNLGEIGIAFLLFIIGIELKPSRLWQMRRLVFGLGSIQVLLTGALIGSLVYFVFEIPLRAAILIGPALALSSTAFVLQILSEQKMLTSVFGRSSIAVLLLQDLAVVPLLALIPLLVLPELSIGEDIGLALFESLVILGLVVLLGRYLLHPILHRVALSGNPEIFTASAVLIVLGAALATEHAGLSMAMGAFLAGLLISDSSYKHQIMAEIQPFRGLLLGLFFVSMGMSLNINLFLDRPLHSLGLLGLLLSIKAIILFPLASLFKHKTKHSIAIALILAQSGEFALVLFSLAFESGLLAEELFQELLLLVLLSMLVTPVLAHFARRFAKAKINQIAESSEAPVAAPIVIAGFGRVGHRIGEILMIADKPFVALDADAMVVEKQRANGFPVFYGDVRKPELLKAAGAHHANIVIITLNDQEAAEQVVSSLRKAYPEIAIYSRGRSLNDCRNLRELGATGVVSENLEASIELARTALSTAGLNEVKLDRMLETFRRKYHAQLNSMK